MAKAGKQPKSVRTFPHQAGQHVLLKRGSKKYPFTSGFLWGWDIDNPGTLSFLQTSFSIRREAQKRATPKKKGSTRSAKASRPA